MEFIDAWQAELTEAGPCGVDVSFAPEFEELKAEVEKEASLHSEASADWKRVLELATGILSATSKDLWVYCYGIRAVYALHGLSGCAVALSILNKAISAHWAKLHPKSKRPARKAAPFIWLSARFVSLFPADAFPHASIEEYKEFKTQLGVLQSLLDEKFKDDAPSFSAILRSIPDIKGSDSDEISFPAQAATTQFKSAASGESSIAPENLPKLFRAVQDNALQLAAHYMSLDIKDWRIYLLHRTALWSTIVQLPQHNGEQITPVRPVPKDKILSYQAAVEGKQYAAVLPQLERSASRQAFWFDGHYLVAQCLEGLEAFEALHILHCTLRQFATRYPELVIYCFYDGTPFASPKTQLWLEGLLAEPATVHSPRLNNLFANSEITRGAGKMPERPASGHSSDSLVDGVPEGDAASLAEGASGGELCGSSVAPPLSLLEQALAAAAEGDIQTGLNMLGTGPLGRNRASVKRALLQSEFLMALGKEKSAFYLLNSIYKHLKNWGMLEWEPELSAQLIALLQSTQLGKALDEKDEMLGRLHWLHLETALTVSR